MNSIEESNAQLVHCTTAHKRYDGRIFERQAKSLAEFHNVKLIVADGLGKETRDGVTIDSIYSSIESASKAKKITKVLRMFLVLYKMRKKLKIIHTHDPELIWAVSCLKILTLGRISAVYDKHEDTSAQIMIRERIPIRLRYLISKLYETYEYLNFLVIDCVVHVAPNILEKSNCKNNVLVRNFPSIDLLLNNQLETAAVKRPNGDFILFYPGSLSESRGILVMLDSLKLLPEEVSLVLMGKWTSEKIQKTSEAHPEWSRVTYLGVQPWEKVLEQLNRSHLVLQVPLNVGQYGQGMYSLKVIEALACGKSVVVSESKNRRAVYGDCVFYTVPGDASDLALQVKQVMDDKVATFEKQKLGRKIIEQEYNWEKEFENLKLCYKELLI